MIFQQNRCPTVEFHRMLALAKPVKLSPFVRPKNSRFPAQRQACFVQNTTLKFARKSRQFMKIQIGSDEKFSSGFFARSEFLHSLQVIFQFINTTSFLGIGKFFGEISFFGFSRVAPFPPAAMNGLFKFIFVSVYLLAQQKLFIQNIKAVKFSFSRASNFFSKANEIRTLPFSLTRVSQMSSLRRPP